MIWHLDDDAIDSVTGCVIAVGSLRQRLTKLIPPASQLIIENKRRANATGPAGPIERCNGSVTIQHLSIEGVLNWRHIGPISHTPHFRGVVECNWHTQ